VSSTNVVGSGTAAYKREVCGAVAEASGTRADFQKKIISL
jgi:hypothetical protein